MQPRYCTDRCADVDGKQVSRMPSRGSAESKPHACLKTLKLPEKPPTSMGMHTCNADFGNLQPEMDWLLAVFSSGPGTPTAQSAPPVNVQTTLPPQSRSAAPHQAMSHRPLRHFALFRGHTSVLPQRRPMPGLLRAVAGQGADSRADSHHKEDDTFTSLVRAQPQLSHSRLGCCGAAAAGQGADPRPDRRHQVRRPLQRRLQACRFCCHEESANPDGNRIHAQIAAAAQLPLQRRLHAAFAVVRDAN